MNIKMYFCHRFPLAYSVMTMGRAAGMIVLPILAERLMENLGWRGALLILAGINFNVLVSAALNRKKNDKEICAPSQIQTRSIKERWMDALSRCRSQNNQSQTGQKNLECAMGSDDTNIATSNSNFASSMSSGNTLQTYGTNEDIEMGGHINVRGTLEEQHEVAWTLQSAESTGTRNTPFSFSWLAKKVSPVYNMFKNHPAVVLLLVTNLFVGMSMSGVIIFLVPNATEGN